MRQSQLFTKTRKEAPKDEVSKNAILLQRGGFIHKELAGVYAYLPLGLRVLKKIEQIVREEMNALGGQELLMTALQDKTVWEKTDRWDDTKVDNWFKTTIKNGTETGLAITHEEPLTNIMTEYVSSYRDLPFSVYQFQTKFRNETRAKSGIMRGREFLMKDLYSFCRSREEHDSFYEQAKQAYFKVYKRLGIGDVTYLTFASGGIFSQYSHEFQTISEAGEDIIYIDESKNIAINKEVFTEEVLKDLGVNKDSLVERKSVEVGNIFTLSTRFSKPLELSFTNEEGEALPVFMGSYGIGVSRLMGTIVEVMSDEKGIVWPEVIAPFQVHVVQLGEDSDIKRVAEQLYSELSVKGIEVLIDDRTDTTAGQKFADADLIGIPWRVVVSTKSLEKGGVEMKARTSDESQIVSIEACINTWDK